MRCGEFAGCASSLYDNNFKVVFFFFLTNFSTWMFKDAIDFVLHACPPLSFGVLKDIL